MKNGGAHREVTARYPISTLGGRELVPAGTVLTRERIAEIAAGEAHEPAALVSMFGFGSVRDDMLRSLSRAPYRVIFDPPRRVEEVLEVLERVRLPLPVLHSLDFFKTRDEYTYLHTLMVFALSSLLAQDLLASDRDRMREAVAGPVHDFGKISIPLSVLKKSDPLTRTERGLLEHHTVAGFVLLTHYLGDSSLFGARAARDHHERGDGSGYPRGLFLEDRMVDIIAASDVYDALISPRPYRPTSYDNRTALEELTEMGRNGKLSRETVQALVALNRREKPHFRECDLSEEKRGVPPAGNLYGVVAEEGPEGDPR